jgi:hypothetical protein
MAHLYRAEEFELNGRYFVNDTNIIDSSAPYWWVPCRILGISPADYVLLLKDKFHATKISYTTILHFSFDTLEDARTYKNFINRKAREKNFII